MRRLINVFRAAGRRFSADGCAFLAQAIAFNALFAMFPLALLTIAGLAFVYGTNQGQAEAIALFATLAPGIQEALTENLHQLVNLRSVSGIIGVVTLIWSGKNLFQAIAYALNKTLNIPTGRKFINDILVSLVMLPIVGILLLIATALPIVISIAVSYGGFPRSALFSQLVTYTTCFLLIVAISALLYAYLPNRRVGIGFGVPGAIFTGIAWEVAQIAFGIYTTHVSFAHVYGAVATLAVLLLWLYYMGIIFLFGAELSAQWWASPSGEREAALETRRTA